jgi:maltooligosyltrehalose trehalohydrolase
MRKDARGHFETVAEDVLPGSLYKIRLGDLPERPDPASRFQPRGSQGPSQVVDLSFPWTDPGWTGLPLDRYAFYELHVGTFTPEGTFKAVIPRLDSLKELGITAVEIMPVAQFPGDRNWGYDGTFPFAVQDTYGGPAGFQELVDACHRRGLAVVLDVVYNHVGHEGNALWGSAPFFTDRHKTPWGSAMNFDGPGSDEVREFFLQSALGWIRDFHVDALRLDAVHAIMDSSARPFLEELAGRVRETARALGRQVHLIAESDRNDPRLVRPPGQGGYGLDAVWNDDFHHSLHVLLTGERDGYYEDFGTLEQLGRAYTEGFVFSGQHSGYRGRRHGAPSGDLEPSRFVVFAQNHDQIGNRMLGERLASMVPFEKLKLAAGLVLLSPNLPLLFMGEEYGETAPFPYFCSFTDPALIEGIRNGRREEFARFRWKGEPPDPQDEETFRKARLNGPLPDHPRHAALRSFHRELLGLRRRPPFSALSREGLSAKVHEGWKALALLRTGGGARATILCTFSDQAAEIPFPAEGRRWMKVLDSADPRWGGPGAAAPDTIDGPVAGIPLPPASVCVYLAKETEERS